MNWKDAPTIEQAANDWIAQQAMQGRARVNALEDRARVPDRVQKRQIGKLYARQFPGLRWTADQQKAFERKLSAYSRAERLALAPPSTGIASKAAMNIPEDEWDDVLEAVSGIASEMKSVSSHNVFDRSLVAATARLTDIGGTVARWSGLMNMTDAQKAFAHRLFLARQAADPVSDPNASALNPKEAVVRAAGMAPDLAVGGAVGKAAGVAAKALGAGARAVGLAEMAGSAASFAPGMYDATYDDLLTQGVKPSTARWAAGLSAAGQSALFAGIPKMLLPKLGGEQAVAKGLSGALVNYAKSTGKADLMMSSAAMVDDAAKQLATQGELDYGRLVKVGVETAKESALPVAMIGAPRGAQEALGARRVKFDEIVARGGKPSRSEARALGAPPEVVGKAKDRKQWFEEYRSRQETVPQEEVPSAQQEQKPVEVYADVEARTGAEVAPGPREEAGPAEGGGRIRGIGQEEAVQGGMQGAKEGKVAQGAQEVVDLSQPVAEPQPYMTSIKNEVVTRLRKNRGLAEIEGATPETLEQWLDEAHSLILKDETRPSRLIEEIRKNPRGIDRVEVAMLQLHKRELHNYLGKASKRLNEASDLGDAVEVAKAQMEMELIGKELQHTDEASKIGNRGTARSLRAVQMELKEDFSLGATVERIQAAQGGKPLSSEQNAKVTFLSKRIMELEDQLSKRADDRALSEQQWTIDRNISEAAKPQKKIPSAKRVAAQKAVDAAWNDFSKKATGKLFANPIDPELVLSAAKLTKAYIDLGVVTFSEFMANVKQRLGDKSEIARDTFAEAWRQLKGRGEVPPLDIDVEVPGSIVRAAKRITRAVVEAGTKDREAVVDAVHEELSQVIPDLTRRQTMDAMSGYGQYKELTKDEISVAVRDISGQLQQLAKLEDMQKGSAPKKTGVERRTPTDEERRLLQQVNEAKKRGGFTVTDPNKQLKSALDGAKRAVRNRIADLETEIKTRKKIVAQRTPLTPDAELLRLQKQRDALREEHEKVFPKAPATDAQKAVVAGKTLDRAIAQLEADLKSGAIGKKLKKAPVSTPELDAKRARLDALREERQALREAANPKVSPEELSNQAYKRALTKRLAEYQERVKNKDFAKKPIKKRTLDSDMTQKLYEIEQEKDKLRILERNARKQNRTLLGKIFDTTISAANLHRSIRVGGEFSYILRQGKLPLLSRPFQWARALPTAFKMFLSEFNAFEAAEKLQKRPRAKEYREGRLRLTTQGVQGRQQELYQGEWTKKVPLLAGTARAMEGFSNEMSANVFDVLADTLVGKGKPLSSDQAKMIGNMVNVETGQATLGRLESAAELAATFLYSPRFALSRVEYALGQPLWKPIRMGDRAMTKLIAKEYVRAGVGWVLYKTLKWALVGYGIKKGLKWALGEDDEEPGKEGASVPTTELDPRSSDFMKERTGNTRIDPGAGMLQPIVATSKVITGWRKDSKGKLVPIREYPNPFGKKQKVPYGGERAVDTIARFGRTKLAPIPGGIVDFLTGENVVGEAVTASDVLKKSFLPYPMAYEDIIEVVKEEQLSDAMIDALQIFFGEGGMTFEPKKSKKQTSRKN